MINTEFVHTIGGIEFHVTAWMEQGDIPGEWFIDDLRAELRDGTRVELEELMVWSGSVSEGRAIDLYDYLSEQAVLPENRGSE